MSLSDAERVTNAETMRHILTVRALLMEGVEEFCRRARAHDVSKLGPPEVDLFTEWTPKLAKLTYGSPEYADALKQLGPALENHYAKNAHHPEHHEDGVLGMDLFDLIEMLLDWKAATLRHADGDLERSLRINADRFGMPEALVRILGNTLPKIQSMAQRARVAVSYPHVEDQS